MEDLRGIIRDVPDFPKQGIIFKDITPLLRDGSAFRKAIDFLYGHYKDKDIDVVLSVESRGFILGSVLAYKLGAGFVPVRKKGKLPYKTHAVTYDLEYGKDTLEIHEDAISPSDKVLIVDDLLATGGTVQAVAGLTEKMGGDIVGIGFLIELTFLKGRERIKDYEVISLIKY
ncbi:MAG: adenine phosphoribosyltransferase [Candidatus Omnitrophica bacterium]|nr:adenine phosphoribosyltransferase [Candidatus Omnitrophota bacterium]